MSTRETLQRHTIIINWLRKGAASFEEIANRLELESKLQGYDFNISKRTFQRDVETIESLYGIISGVDLLFFKPHIKMIRQYGLLIFQTKRISSLFVNP